jgi:diacylglycerol kinase family enzyme
MMASRPQTALRPTCILNGKSVHLQAAMRHIPRISGEFGAETQVLVTKRGDEISSLAVQALAERCQPVVAGGGDGTVNAIAGKLAGSDTLPTKRNGVRCSNASA